ncbi:MAG TPA: hypothetical protein VKM93_03165, partial [Terriglobia bacterium]|nr:hypothetical protein [Terriglobia bacterium]
LLDRQSHDFNIGNLQPLHRFTSRTILGPRGSGIQFYYAALLMTPRLKPTSSAQIAAFAACEHPHKSMLRRATIRAFSISKLYNFADVRGPGVFQAWLSTAAHA